MKLMCEEECRMADERDSVGETLKMIGAGVVGAIVAGGLALLLAPKAGSELRHELKDVAKETSEKLSEVTHTVAEKLKEKAVEVKDKATTAAKAAIEQVQEEGTAAQAPQTEPAATDEPATEA